MLCISKGEFMKTIVVYSSQYSATEQYARWLAEALDADLYAVRAISADVLGGYDCILYGGGLYAGGVKGLPTFLKHFSKCEGKPLILFTCGIADPKDPANVEQIRSQLHKALPANIAAQCTFFHLRGRLDYPHLTVVHRAMMAMLRKMLLKKAPSSLREEDRQLLETYGKDVNFIDRSEIEPIVSFVRRGAE